MKNIDRAIRESLNVGEQMSGQQIPYKGPPRDKVMVAVPGYDFKADFATINGLLQCLPFYVAPLLFGGCSCVALARNEIAHIFVEKFPLVDWLVMIDADTGFGIQDWFYLMEGEEELVIASYAKKLLGEAPVEFGLGFAKVHRRVFEKMKALKCDDGSERLNRFYHKGEMMVDYFPNGALESGRWIGEDQGFFMWAGLAQVTPRLEKRTRLMHYGRFGYGYPEQVPGFQIVMPEDGAQ
jgi:hypothetical protein